MHMRELCATLCVVTSYGQCKASVRNGDRCRVVIETEAAEFCPHHLRLAAEYGAETVRRGAVPKEKRAVPVVDVSPAVTSATMTTVPILHDLLARVAAIERLLDEALGRPSTAGMPHLPQKP